MTNRFLGCVRRGRPGVHAGRPGSDREDPGLPGRPLSAQRAEPIGEIDPSSITGSSATAWCTASGSVMAGPSGTATAGCGSADRGAIGEASPAGECRTVGIGANTNVIGHAGRTLA